MKRGWEQAKLQAQAQKIQSEAELEEILHRQEADLGFLRRRNDLEILQAREMAQIEVINYQGFHSQTSWVNSMPEAPPLNPDSPHLAPHDSSVLVAHLMHR